MKASSTHWKVGLFVVLGVFGCIAGLVWLSASKMRSEEVGYVSYFDESVQGLNVGSPVKFRGVTIGAVSAIEVGPDHRHVETVLALDVRELERLGLATGHKKTLRVTVPPDVRVQLGSSGLTGVKFISLDFFDPKTHPPKTLPFTVPAAYIPSTDSTMKSLEDAVVTAVESIPQMTAQMLVMIGKVNRLLDDVDALHLGDRADLTLGKVNALLGEAQVKLDGVDTEGLSRSTQQTLAKLNATMAMIDHTLDRVGGEKGLIVSAQRATDAVGDIAVEAHAVGPELEATMRDLQKASGTMRDLLDALNRHPDMLIKGRAKVAP